MGILDDAIRQHLDLKRRQGAEADEIQRLESEAFGPPTRPGEPDFPETGEATAVAPSPAAEEAPPAVEEPPLAAEQDAPAQTFFDHDAEDQQSDAGAATEEPAGAVPFEVDDPASHLEVLADPSPPEPEPAVGEPPIESLDTIEHDFEGAITDTGEAELVEGEPVAPESPPTGEQEAEESDEDVLEETPEFLRDQPEDDELWFEQGEPKDFDF
jgi:hypothetical protein